MNRQKILKEIATKLLEATVDPNKYGTTLTITGAGGFGKTSTVISLCHYPVVNNHFTDGFVFIELGPQATDPSIKLRDIYNLLTGEKCGINVVEQKINQLISEYYHRLLVIIDDVWHVEDAEPLVKAFSNCKIILTTSMNDIEQYIPSKQSVTIGPMTKHEAITLLTSGVIDISQLSQEDVDLLYELAQDVHLWPLLLSLIRGHLSHTLKQHCLPNQAIQSVQAKLYRKGLTAFDKSKSRNLAVKVCIEITLELLKEPLSHRIKILILYNGIGTSALTALLNNLWNISNYEAEDTIDTLWAYGLVQFSNTTMSRNNITLRCVEVHAVISQYIIECMDSMEVCNLSPLLGLRTPQSTSKLICDIFQESYGVSDPLLLTPMDFLQFKLREMEDALLPSYLKGINILLVTGPHEIIIKLQDIKSDLRTSSHYETLLQIFDNESNALIAECKENLKSTHKWCRQLNQSIQEFFYKEKNYDMLIQTVEKLIKSYPWYKVAQNAAEMMQKIISCCNSDVILQAAMMIRCEQLQKMTSNYHMITTLLLPFIELQTKIHKQISSALQDESPTDIALIHTYYMSGQYKKEFDLVGYKYHIKLQELSPDFAKKYSGK